MTPQEKYAGKTDRQLLEEQTYLAEARNYYLKSIEKYISIFFWLIMASIGLYFLVLLVMETQ